jgi:hypothetical protein
VACKEFHLSCTIEFQRTQVEKGVEKSFGEWIDWLPITPHNEFCRIDYPYLLNNFDLDRIQ